MTFLYETLAKQRELIQQKDILTDNDFLVLNKIDLKMDSMENDAKIFFDDDAFVPKRLGDFIKAKIKIKTLMDSDEMYFYDKGLYLPHGKEVIKGMSVVFLQDRFKTSYMNEAIEYIKASTYIDPNDVNNGWLNLENGLLNIDTMEFKNHTPDIFSIVRLPIIYNPAADCILWKEKLKEKLDEIAIKVVQEMFGYCFMPGQILEKAFLLYGPKRTMKSTVLFILSRLLGHTNITALPLQQLTDDSFAVAYIYGKSANICADITTRALRDTGRFLIITGGDMLTAGKKNQHYITFYPSTKLIFSCNTIPATTNKDPAFYRRWIILNFDKQTPMESVDPLMKKKMEAELPGILNWAIEGMKRLKEKEKFSYLLTEDEIKDLYERSSDTIQSFIFNRINTDEDEGALTKREVFNGYLKYCKENNLQPENVIKFGRMFIALTGCGVGRKGTGEEQLPAYKGVSWKEKTNKKEKLDDFTTDDEYENDNVE